MLIEDDRLDRMAFLRMAEDSHLPYDCTAAGAVSQVNTILASERFDIIIVDSLLGDGTTFTVVLPLTSQPTSDARTPTQG